jgi:hypothetical protein
MGELTSCSLFVIAGSSPRRWADLTKAEIRRLRGHIPPQVRFLAFDVPAVPVIEGEVKQGSPVSNGHVELGREYLALGEDFSPIRVREAFERRTDDPIAWLIKRTTTARHARSLDIGAQADRAAGRLAVLWSEAEATQRLESDLRELAGLSMRAETGVPLPIRVFVVCNEGGGTGGASALFLLGLVRKAMYELGLGLERALFFTVTFSPETVSSEEINLSNAYDFLAEAAICQREGLIPLSTIEEKSGSPVDIAFRLGTQLSNGALIDQDTCFALAARSLALMAVTPVGQEAMERYSNLMGRLMACTPAGEPTFLSTLGLAAWRFSGPDFAAAFARHAVGLLAKEWTTDVADTSIIVAREDAIATLHSISDSTALMVRLNSQIQVSLRDFEHELRDHLRGEQFASNLLERLVRYERRYSEALAETHAGRFEQVRKTIEPYQGAMSAEAAFQADKHLRPKAAIVLADAALRRLRHLRHDLGDAHRLLREWQQTRLTEENQARQELEAAAASSVTGLLRGLRRPLTTYLKAVSRRFATETYIANTEGAIAAISDTEAAIEGLRSQYAGLQQELRLLADQADSTIEKMLAPDESVIAAVLDRRLDDADDWQPLFEHVTGSAWSELNSGARARAEERLLAPSRLLAFRATALADLFADALLPEFESLSEMTADAFLYWKAQRLGRDVDLFVRDLEANASFMCQVDKVRLHLLECHPQEFALLAVPDRASSSLGGTSAGLLVSSHDPTHVALLRFRVAFPPSAIPQFKNYKAANEKMRRLGLGTQDILDIPYELAEAWWEAEGEPTPDSTQAISDSRPRRGRPRRNA